MTIHFTRSWNPEGNQLTVIATHEDGRVEYGVTMIADDVAARMTPKEITECLQREATALEAQFKKTPLQRVLSVGTRVAAPDGYEGTVCKANRRTQRVTLDDGRVFLAGTLRLV